MPFTDKQKQDLEELTDNVSKKIGDPSLTTWVTDELTSVTTDKTLFNFGVDQNGYDEATHFLNFIGDRVRPQE